MKINVLQHHIDAGVRGASEGCAIALALQEQFPEAIVTVGLTCASIDLATWTFADTDAPRFISEFDGGLPVEPFEFDMEPVKNPKPVLK